MKRKLLMAVCLVIIGALLSGCCILGDACESGINDAIDATQTAAYKATADYGAQQLTIQLTALATARP